MNVVHIIETDRAVEDVGTRLEDAAKTHQFGVINVVDMNAKMKSKGVDFEPRCIIYEVCNPHRAKEVLEHKLEISTALPCRISVYEEAGKTKLATLIPTQVLGLMGGDALQPVAESIQTDIFAMMDEAAGA